MFLYLELTVVGSALDISADEFRDSCQNDESFRELLGLYHGNTLEVVLVEAICQDWVGACIEVGVLELILNDELLAEEFGCLFGNLVVTELEGNFSKVTVELMQRQR